MEPMDYTRAIAGVLTVPRHSGSDAFLQAAVLAPVAVDPEDAALLVLGARAVLDLLLDRATKESLEQNKDRFIIRKMQTHNFS